MAFIFPDSEFTLRWVETPVIAVWIIWFCFWLYSFWLPLMLAGKSYNSDSNSRGAHIPTVDTYLYTGIVRQPHFKLRVNWISLSHRYVIIAQGNKLLHARGGGGRCRACWFVCKHPGIPQTSPTLSPWHTFCVTFPQQFTSPSMQTKGRKWGKKEKSEWAGKRLEKLAREGKQREGQGGNCFRTKAREVIWGEQTEGVVRGRRE